jgi:hypothetical protein
MELPIEPMAVEYKGKPNTIKMIETPIRCGFLIPGVIQISRYSRQRGRDSIRLPTTPMKAADVLFVEFQSGGRMPFPASLMDE